MVNVGRSGRLVASCTSIIGIDVDRDHPDRRPACPGGPARRKQKPRRGRRGFKSGSLPISTRNGLGCPTIPSRPLFNIRGADNSERSTAFRSTSATSNRSEVSECVCKRLSSSEQRCPLCRVVISELCRRSMMLRLTRDQGGLIPGATRLGSSPSLSRAHPQGTLRSSPLRIARA